MRVRPLSLLSGSATHIRVRRLAGVTFLARWDSRLPMTSVVSSATRTQRTVLVVIVAWLLAGTFDITTAVLYYLGPSSARAAGMLRGIASGILGARAFDGG